MVTVSWIIFADGRYMIEVDRVLRPGGYWVLSGPPINWKTNYKAWQRPKEELQEEQRKIEEIANLLCWEKKSEKGEIAVWQKKVNDESCRARRDDSRANFCKSSDADDVWCVAALRNSHHCTGFAYCRLVKIYAVKSYFICISLKLSLGKRFM